MEEKPPNNIHSNSYRIFYGPTRGVKFAEVVDDGTETVGFGSSLVE